MCRGPTCVAAVCSANDSAESVPGVHCKKITRAAWFFPPLPLLFSIGVGVIPEPMSEPMPEPIPELSPEPIPELIPEPILKLTPESIPE